MFVVDSPLNSIIVIYFILLFTPLQTIRSGHIFGLGVHQSIPLPPI